MEQKKPLTSILTAAIAVCLLAGAISPEWAHGSGYCGSGAATPPFLSGGVDPNLLLVLDNSGSMLDLAYVPDQSTCYDDSFSTAGAYAGYFDAGTWYAYDFAGETFIEKTTAQAVAICGASAFTSGDACINGTVIGGELTTLTGFAATGNLLNWAASSKLDIQKEILTGGKYEAGDFRLVMESRGCGDRRFVKEVPVANASGSTYHLTLAVRPPREPQFDRWENGKAYSTGDVVNDLGSLYVATSSGTSSGTGAPDDAGVSWSAYTQTRWTNGVFYPAGSIVSDPGKANTIDKGQLYLTAAGGTAGGTGVDNDTGITDWVPYDTTQIEIFKVTASGFDNSACQSAIDEMGKESPNQGQLKQYINDCMGYVSGGTSTEAANSHAAFNHAIHNCWYKAKHGIWPPGSGAVNSQKNACEDIYGDGVDPWQITPDDRGYGCYGLWLGSTTFVMGYVGRCWHPGTGSTLTCTKYKRDGSCLKWEWVGGTAPGWHASGYADVDTCIEAGMRDYCGIMEIPEVIDPSDQMGGATGATDEMWNIPAVLIDSGVVAQLDQPLAVLQGHIGLASPPTGLIQEFADDIRMGAMAFNDEGSKSECTQPDPFVLYNCAKTSNRDGGAVIAGIDMSPSHTTDLVDAINAIKALSWTPLSEAYYNAMGYFAQRSDLRLDSGDFSISTGDDPITAWCQDNHILIITEGASTADLNSTVTGFAGTEGQNDTDAGDTDPSCGALSGSTLLDDLTYFAKRSPDLYSAPMDDHDKRNISTHIVAAGTLRSSGTDECSPDVLLGDAATNGGTTLYNATDPEQLENALRDAFAAIRAGAAAGSAASVISASRGGEGAVYQAIFWAGREDMDENALAWSGEVHALLVDSHGFMYEDTNHNHQLDAGDQKVVFYFDEGTGVSKACNGDITAEGTCTGTSKNIDQVHYLWSAARWLSDITPTAADTSQDILQNRTLVGSTSGYISSSAKRFIFTWNDLDNDGIVDSGEVLDFDPTNDWAGLTVAGSRGPVPLDFGVETSGEVNEIIKWVRGLDQTGQRSRQILSDFDLDGVDETVTWRLGDVVHSTPISVAGPAEGFQFLYRDPTYADFVQQYKKRRHMIYFGGNDGMLHAVNGGFYNEADKRFCRTAACGDEGATPGFSPDLGAELWAYVPYNLLPHLKCLTDPNYAHKYFVDLRPRIFDVRIFPDDADHPGGWGTILVGAMRFGGAKVLPASLDVNGDGTADHPSDTRELTSAYFILDITNPEKPPELLGEMTRTTSGGEVDLAYTAAIPTIVTMKNGPDENDHQWYLVLGSGPTDVDGTSDQAAKLAVMPLSWLVDSPVLPFRISDALPTAGSNQGGTFTLDGNAFVSDLVSVDFELEENYRADVVYFGTISGDWGAWGGKMYRLVTRKLDADGSQIGSQPSDWSSLLSPKSNPLPLMDVGQPISAPAAVGIDGDNYWVYFGTGRFLHDNDRTDAGSNATQTFYGIKEPRSYTEVGGDCISEFTWETVEKTGTRNSTPGAQGMLQVDAIQVAQGTTYAGSTLSCSGGGTGCLPTDVEYFGQLVDHIAGAGPGCGTGSDFGLDGWYKDFGLDRERNVGQATLLGGLLTYTTYQPFVDPCMTEGLGFLYGVFYQTGTPFFIPVFVSGTSDGVDAGGNVEDRVALGRGLATTPNLHVGRQEGAKAFVQTSTGTIVEIPQPNLPIRNAKAGRSSWGVVR